VRQVAEAHGAEVMLDEGEEGRGLRVTVRFRAA
jgi:signal transduction histidine kinase